MFLLMLLKYSKKSADVSLKPAWAACKSPFITPYGDPLLPKQRPQRQTGRSRGKKTHDNPIIGVYIRRTKDKLYGIARKPLPLPLPSPFACKGFVLFYSSCFRSISYCAVALYVTSHCLFYHAATRTRPDKPVHLQLALVYG